MSVRVGRGLGLLAAGLCWVSPAAGQPGPSGNASADLQLVQVEHVDVPLRTGWTGSVAPAARVDPDMPATGEAPAPDSPAVQPETSTAQQWHDNPHTTFEFGVGMMALPWEEVCPTSLDACELGETSIALSVQNLYHISVFAFGAGITWAFGLKSNVAAGDEDGSLGREHSRSYFLVEGQFRYYFARFTSWEFWTGATLGGVVINDSWDTLADREPYSGFETVGPRAQTMSTEGFAAGLGVGFQWNFTDWGIFGSRFRYANWFLPEEREESPTGDPVSLAGRVDVFDFGLSVAARLDI